MKRLPGVKETNVPLNAVSLDLRAPAGKTTEGYFRLIVNAISGRDRRLRRLGGWRALSLTTPANRNNEDLHDQLLTNAINPIARIELPSYPVISWGYLAYSPGASTVTTATIVVTGPTVATIDYNINTVDMPTVSVVPPETRTYVPYATYSWRTSVKATGAILSNNPGWVDLSCYSFNAGGRITVRFYTTSASTIPVDSLVYVYGCAPADAAQWMDVGSSDQVMLWDFNAQDNILVQPANTMVLCP